MLLLEQGNGFQLMMKALNVMQEKPWSTGIISFYLLMIPTIPSQKCHNTFVPHQYKKVATFQVSIKQTFYTRVFLVLQVDNKEQSFVQPIVLVYLW